MEGVTWGKCACEIITIFYFGLGMKKVTWVIFTYEIMVQFIRFMCGGKGRGSHGDFFLQS